MPVIVYAIGAGPLKEPVAQALVRDCLSNATVITVRERGARKVLEEAGVEREIVVTADPALLLEPSRCLRARWSRRDWRANAR